MSDRLAILRKLGSIGGDVEESEIAYHCGEEAIFELLDAETEGLVESRTFFMLTERGVALSEGEQGG